MDKVPKNTATGRKDKWKNSSVYQMTLTLSPVDADWIHVLS
jgi:hypothetical protein